MQSLHVSEDGLMLMMSCAGSVWMNSARARACCWPPSSTRYAVRAPQCTTCGVRTTTTMVVRMFRRRRSHQVTSRGHAADDVLQERSQQKALKAKSKEAATLREDVRRLTATHKGGSAL